MRVHFFFLLFSSFLVSLTQSAIIDNNDPKFLAGYHHLFSSSMNSYPFQLIYNIIFARTLPLPTSYYDLVVSVNSFEFMESNNIGWAFVKQNLTYSGFQLKYQAGINAAIYTLTINYFLVDNAYQDYDIAYKDITCSVMSQGIGYRSQNISYSSKKFSNDSKYRTLVVFQSFNITNTQNDNLIVRYTSYQNNLTAIIEFYTAGQSKVHDFQAYIILYNLAYMEKTLERIVYVSFESVSNVAAASNIDSKIDAPFKKRERLFAGVAGFNFTRYTNRSFELKFNINQVFDFQLNTIGVKSLDLAILSTYVVRCTAGLVYRMPDKDCITSCPMSQFLHTLNGLSFCRVCHYSCNNCWDWKQTSCKSCKSTTTRNQAVTATNSSGVWKSCFCKTSFYEAFKEDCESCGIYMSGCIKCSSNSSCQQCKIGMKLLNNKCVCNNPNQFFSDPSNQCIDRIIGCETHTFDGLNLICTECHVQRNFTLNSAFKCSCQQPLYQIIEYNNQTDEHWCNYKCGDGYVGLGEPCDDKNTLSGDGCSQKCQVETNFQCTNLTNQPSVCNYNISVSLLFHTAERVMYQNTAVLNFTFEPSIYFMNEIQNWSALVITDMPVSKIEHDFICPDIQSNSKCNLTLTVQYTDNLEEQLFYIELRTSDHSKINYDSKRLYFSPTGQIATLTHEPQEHLSMIKTLNVILLVVVILGLVIFLVSIYFEKMVGIELIVTLQYIYYLLTPINYNPIELVPFQRNLKFSTGFNQIYNYTYYRYAPLPNNLNHQFYEKQFLMNMNIMVLGLFLVVTLLIAAKLFKMFQQNRQQSPKKDIFMETDHDHQINQKFHRFYKLYWNKIFFVYVFFVMYQVLFDCVISTLIEHPNEDIFSPSLNFFAQILSFTIMMMGFLSVGYWYYQGKRHKGRISLDEEKILPYQFKLCSQSYIMVFVIIQPIKIWTIAIFFVETYCFYMTLSILVINFVLLVVWRPYKPNLEQQSQPSQKSQQNYQYSACISVHNFGICFNQFCLIMCNLLFMVWNLKAKDSQFSDEYPQIMLGICITLIFLLEIVAIFRLLYKKIPAVLFCDYFKKYDPNALTFDNAYANMRKLIRDSDLKRLQQNDANLGNNEQDKNKMNKQDKSKILQDIKRSKDFLINWKDQPKPKYFYNQNNNYDSSSSDQQDAIPNKYTTQFIGNKQISNPNDLSYFKRRRKIPKNPGVFQMQSLTKGIEQSQYQINKISDSKTAYMKKSIAEYLVDNKEFQMMANYQIESNVFTDDPRYANRKGEQDLNEIKHRMRVQFIAKKNSEQLQNHYP